MDQDILVEDPARVDPNTPVPGLTERTLFHVDDYRLVLLETSEESSWHYRSGAIYGWVHTGHGHVTHDERRIDLASGDFLHVAPDTVHDYVAGDDQLAILAVIDDGPDVTAVDEPSTGKRGAEVEVVGGDGLVPTAESPNLTRETPFPDAPVLMMRVQAAGGAAAGWHHHGDNVYFGYAVDGPSETEYGPAGEAVARIEIGECFHVPPGLVHRDTNPTDHPHIGIIWLCGGEPWVMNVDGPQ